MTPLRTPWYRRLDLDMNDGFFFAGLAVAGIGGAMLSLAWTLVIIGAVVTAIGLTGAR